MISGFTSFEEMEHRFIDTVHKYIRNNYSRGIVFLIDTSTSIDDEMYTYFGTFVSKIVRTAYPSLDCFLCRFAISGTPIQVKGGSNLPILDRVTSGDAALTQGISMINSPPINQIKDMMIIILTDGFIEDIELLKTQLKSFEGIHKSVVVAIGSCVHTENLLKLQIPVFHFWTITRFQKMMDNASFYARCKLHSFKSKKGSSQTCRKFHFKLEKTVTISSMSRWDMDIHNCTRTREI